MKKKFNEKLKDLSDDIKAFDKDLRLNVGLQLLYTGLLLNKYIDLKSKNNGANRNQFEVLYALVSHGGSLRPTDLSRIIFRSKQNITSVVDSLESKGLVTRELLGKDRRSKRVNITNQGLELVRASIPATLEITHTYLPKLGEKDVSFLGDILRKIRKHLKNQLDNHVRHG